MKKIFAFLKRLFASSKTLIAKYVRPSVLVVQEIKFFLDHPVTPLINAIIPGQVDDIITAKIKSILPEVLTVLGYTDECFNNGKNLTGDQIFQCAIAKLRLMRPDGQDAALHNIASLLSKYLADGKLSWREALHLAEETFQEIKPNAAA